MVDVSGQAETVRAAVACGRVVMKNETLETALSQKSRKGDVAAVAELAGIMAAKKTAELVPLCHPLPLSAISVEVSPATDESALRVVARVKTTAPTGVEMEALAAVSVACLAIYDMLKAVDRGMRIDDIRLLEKTGGRSGDFRASDE